MKDNQLNNFTFIRLLLATLVVLGHFKILPGNNFEYTIFKFSGLAVDAFFVISGYLVYASYDQLPDAGRFYVRRIFRIYPLYFVIILVQAIIMAHLAGGIEVHFKEFLRYLALNMVMLNFLAYDIGGLLANLHDPGINASLWTLKIEVGFYVIVPLIWLFIQRYKWAAVLFIYIASSLYYYIARSNHEMELARQLPGQLRFFIMGVALYIYGRNSAKLPLVASIAFIMAVLPICFMRGLMPVWPLYPVLLGILVYFCVFNLPIINLKRDVSYGVYLFHAPLIQISILLGLFANTMIFLSVLIVVVVVLALLAEKFIERPGIRLGKKLACIIGGKRLYRA